MERTDAFISAFKFFSNYNELSDNELDQLWQEEGCKYSRFVYFEKQSEYNDIILDKTKNEYKAPWDEVISFNDEIGEEEISFQTEIFGDWSFDEFKEDYFNSRRISIERNKTIVLNKLKQFYNDLNQPNKREIYIKTLSQIKGLNSLYKEKPFFCKDLLEKSLGEFYTTTIKLFSNLHPEVENSEIFQHLKVLYKDLITDNSEPPFEEYDDRIELKVATAEAKRFLSCLTNTPSGGHSPIIEESDLDYFLCKHFKGFNKVEEERVIYLNTDKFSQYLISALFRQFYFRCCQSTTLYKIFEKLKQSFPSTYKGKTENTVKNIIVDINLQFEFQRRGITLPY